MDDMNLDIPSSEDAGNDMPEPSMDDQTSLDGGDGLDQMGGDPNAMGGDPNAMGNDQMQGDSDALNAGEDNGNGGLDTTGLTDKQKEDGQAYLDAMKKQNGDQGGDMNAPQMESRFNFKHIIDEVFGEIQPTRPLDRTTKRPNKQLEDSVATEYPNPFTPMA